MSTARFPGLLLLLAALTGCQNGNAATQSESIDSARAWEHLLHQVSLGPRPSGSDAIRELQDYLAAELESYGLEPVRETFTEDTPEGPIEFTNVYADVAGEPSGGIDPPVVILATHFDTKRLPFEFLGANDGASGTAVLLELARLLAAGPPRPVTYRILFLDGEESLRDPWRDPDNRYGSRYHVAQMKRSGLVYKTKACVLLDLVGDKDLRLHTESLSDPRLLSLFFEAAREIGLGRHVGGRREEIKDDHLSFMAENIPSVDLIDLTYGANNRYWHTRSDNLENVSQESLDAIGRIVLAGLDGLEDFALGR